MIRFHILAVLLALLLSMMVTVPIVGAVYAVTDIFSPMLVAIVAPIIFIVFISGIYRASLSPDFN